MAASFNATYSAMIVDKGRIPAGMLCTGFSSSFASLQDILLSNLTILQSTESLVAAEHTS